MQLIQLPEEVPMMTHPIGKMALYDMFFKEEDAKFLVVVGEGGTGKTAALQLVCESCTSHPQIEMIHEGEEPTIIPAKNCDGPTKYIAHKLEFGEKEAALMQKTDTWVVGFQGQFPPRKEVKTE
jgi:hypothetical protein